MGRSRWRVLIIAFLTVVGTVVLSPGQAAHAAAPSPFISFRFATSSGDGCFYAEQRGKLVVTHGDCGPDTKRAWLPQSVVSDIHQIKSPAPGECLTSLGDGTVGMRKCASNPNSNFLQLWQLMDVVGGEPGRFQIISRAGADCLRLTKEGSSASAPRHLGTGPCGAPGTESVWRLLPFDDTVLVRSVYSGKCLEVTDEVATEGGARVAGWSCSAPATAAFKGSCSWCG